MNAGTPCEHGFRLPAEWEPHEATWLAWPHNSNDWPGKFAAIQWVYADIVRHLQRREIVRLIVADTASEKKVRRVLARSGVEDFSRIEFHCLPTDRSWVRDTGPLFVTDGAEIAATCWRFSAWAKYPNWQRDDRVAGKIARRLGTKLWEPKHNGRRVVLEGGAIDVNGRGTLLTTEECLLSSDTQQRNPGMTRDDYETVFRDYLGATKVLWLGNGIVGDDTHGHVDDLARFVGPRTIVTVVETDSGDPNFEPLQENLRRLRQARDQGGRRFKIVELPMPRPVLFDGCRLPASYANFYIANGLVLVPTFNDPNDRVALATLADLFPSREVVGIHSVDFAWGFGTIHCSTQQQPANAV
ncbi:MAG: agmatine deiminase family protein [Acidobacteria bacterium]|nr:agmatine deiminase family protein [Acidobacteriota bacterium]